jgi:hypothetical protein
MDELHSIDQREMKISNDPFVKLCIIHSRVDLYFYIPFEIVSSKCTSCTVSVVSSSRTAARSAYLYCVKHQFVDVVWRFQQQNAVQN